MSAANECARTDTYACVCVCVCVGVFWLRFILRSAVQAHNLVMKLTKKDGFPFLTFRISTVRESEEREIEMR